VASKHFARHIDSNTGFVWNGQSTLDMADILGNGNGFGNGNADAWLDCITGKYDDPDDYKPGPAPAVANLYTNVSMSPYIDGVFIPDGGQGAVKVSSAGHIFLNCPDTSEINARYISNANAIGWVYFLPDGSTSREEMQPIRLNGKLYGTKENPSIFILPNKGITFDLEAMRKAMPGLDIHRFTSVCGIASLEGEKLEGLADFWVLVDGQIRFKATDITRNSSLSKIDIKLNSKDRFLTLIITEGKDHVSKDDWAIFGKPALHLVKKTDAIQ
jgi:hypothetical protein